MRQRGVSVVKPSESTRARPFTSLSCNPGITSGVESTEHPTTRSGQLTLAGYACFLLLFSQQHIRSWCYYSLFQTLATLSSAGQEKEGGSLMGREPGIGTKGAPILSAHRWVEFIASAKDTLTVLTEIFQHFGTKGACSPCVCDFHPHSAPMLRFRLRPQPVGWFSFARIGCRQRYV